MEEGLVRRSSSGTPQGGVILPLLANIYLNVFDCVWNNHCRHLGKLVRYADDFVVMCHRESQANEALRRIKVIMDRMGLILHPEKTKMVNISRGLECFEFLGWTVRKRRSIQRNPRWHFVNRWPSPKSMKSVRKRIHDLTMVRGNPAKNLDELIESLNPVLRGWGNYFQQVIRMANSISWTIMSGIEYSDGCGEEGDKEPDSAVSAGLPKDFGKRVCIACRVLWLTLRKPHQEYHR